MDFIVGVFEWFTESGRWLSSDGIWPRTLEHLWLAVLPMVLAIVVTLPVAVWLGHKRIGEFAANAIVNIGRAIPSFGLLILTAVFLLRVGGISFRFWPVVVTLFALAVPPIFTNAYTAIVSIDPGTVEAARGVGYTESELLWRVEVPVGSPVILAGIHISFLQVLATVPLGAVLSSGGGLGQYVVRGFAQGGAGLVEVFGGAVLIAVLTLSSDWLFTRFEGLVLPDGVRRLSSDDIRTQASVS